MDQKVDESMSIDIQERLRKTQKAILRGEPIPKFLPLRDIARQQVSTIGGNGGTSSSSDVHPSHFDATSGEGVHHAIKHGLDRPDWGSMK